MVGYRLKRTLGSTGSHHVLLMQAKLGTVQMPWVEAVGLIAWGHFDLDYCQALYHEPLARVIAQALPVFDIKFTFTFILSSFARI